MIGEIAALGAALCWTISAVLYRKAVANTKPTSANIIRLSCTSLVLILALLAAGRFGILTSLPSDVIILASISGIIGLGVGDTLYLTSLKLIGVARGVPISCTYPLFNLLLIAALRSQSITLPLALGAVIIVVGIWLLMHVRREDSEVIERSALIKGVTSGIAVAILWAVSILMINQAVKFPGAETLDGALAVNVVRTASVGALILASSPLSDKGLNFLRAPKKTVFTLILAGIVALGLGWYLLTMSFLFIPDARAVPISSTSPLFSMVVAVAVLRERVSIRNAVGALMVVAGIFLIFVS